jgi:raffinose/stachyose/melibiose transport system permease protein
MNRYLFGGGFARRLPFLLLLPGFLLYIIIALGPSIATTFYSFTDATLPGAPINWIGLENYREFLFRGSASRDSLAATRRTLYFMFWVTTIQFSLGLIVALLLNQRIRGRTFFRTLFFMPVILGVAIQGLIWKLFLLPRNGPMANFLDLFGITGSEFLGGQPTEAFAWVIVVQIWANMGITMVIFLAGLQTIPGELYEAARIDGANRFQLFREVTWPLLTPSINTNFLLNIIGSLQAWQLFLVLTGYKAGTQVLGYLVFAEGFGQTSGSTSTSFRQGYAAAASIVLFFLVLIIGQAAQWLVKRREARFI